MFSYILTVEAQQREYQFLVFLYLPLRFFSVAVIVCFCFQKFVLIFSNFRIICKSSILILKPCLHLTKYFVKLFFRQGAGARFGWWWWWCALLAYLFFTSHYIFACNLRIERGLDRFAILIHIRLVKQFCP